MSVTHQNLLFARESLIHFKTISLLLNPNSLKNLVEKFVQLAADKCDRLKEECAAATPKVDIPQVKELEAEEKQENIL